MFSVISYLYVIYRSDRYILYCSMKDKGLVQSTVKVIERL